jgi:4'-phosphopantetheinyl transferase
MIHWLVQTTDAAAGLAEGIAPAGLLSAREQTHLAGLTSAKRRSDWLLGRLAAKNLVQIAIGGREGRAPALDAITIATAPDGAPQVDLSRVQPVPGSAAWEDVRHTLSLSISHSAGRALVALGTGGVAVGADIERVEPRGARFAEDYFTQHEHALVNAATPGARDSCITAIWSAKEAALKALRLGLTVDTRAVTCLPRPRPLLGAAWSPCPIAADPALLGRTAPVLRGWWREEDGFVLTLAVAYEA